VPCEFPEVEELAKHGTFFPPNILGLTDEQVEELKLVDEWGEICIPSGGFTMNKDPVGRRNGKQPTEKMQEVLNRTVGEAKELISKVSKPEYENSKEILNLFVNLNCDILL